MVIAVDFDGTCVTHRYPEIGDDIGAAPVLARLAASGHVLIIWTMRSGKTLQDAVNWYRRHGIPIYGVNVNPDQSAWTQSPKAYAHLYIDDAALGAPVKRRKKDGAVFIDWKKVEKMLADRGLFSDNA